MKHVCIFLGLVLALSGCATTKESSQQGKDERFTYKIKRSYLEGSTDKTLPEDIENSEIEGRPPYEPLQPIAQNAQKERKANTLAREFSDSEKVTIAADKMPLTEFLHYAFGEILAKNYVLAPDLKGNKTPVTLNVSNAISKRELFRLVANVLDNQQVSIDYSGDVFFFQAAALGKAKATIGIGRTIESVPSVAGQILQVIPLKYGIRISMERTIRELIEADIRSDYEQSTLFVMGDRNNILRAIELVQMLDVPANRGKHIGLISLTYIPLEEFVTQTQTLMKNEGLDVGIADGQNKNIALVTLNHIGAAAVFATSEELLNRVRYWASVLDKPTRGDNEQYFVYHPRFARATDLGDSVGRLISLSGGRSQERVQRNNQSTGENADQLANESVRSNRVISASNISFVVDERSNSLIFKTSGSQYQALMPLLERLDVLPKQVLLEVLIAEVTMSDDFKFGVEFALRNSSRFALTTKGAFSAGETGGLNLSFLDGGTEAVASFFKENKFINVLSNPSMLVRDGVSANISVGTDIPVVGGTVSQDGGNVTTNIVYRKTGVDVAVTPTINAQGVVIMNIKQQISNTVDTTAGSGGSPSIFERSLDTEVVVESGRTVLLGGLISEDVSNGEIKVPGFGDLPFIGNLFKERNDSKTKTELVMLVTPRVIERNDDWEKLMMDFQNGLENIRIPLN